MHNAREGIIDIFEKGIFSFRGNAFKTKEKSEENRFFEHIENESKGTDYDLFKKFFDFETPTQLTKKLFEIKDKKKNNDLVEEIKNRWNKLKDGIEKMSDHDEKKNKSDKILEIVNKLLSFNKQQQGKGLKILTRNQMFSRLPIILAQLKAGNNSEKLKNEIKQLLYSLYRSKI